MIENGTLLQDRYLIERKIGAGGMGAVYLAVDQRFGNHVAIKETFFKNDEFGDAFEREARLLNGLHHPVLPHVSDYFTDKHGHFLVMQYIEGEDLSAVLKREGAFPVKDVLRWIDNLLDALDYLHSQNPPIIHRDIKPQNLKITPRSDIILLDFGLAKLKSEDTTGVKSVFGYSRKYSPLEQIQGTGTDARSDIFSLGATAYQLLTGKPPIDVLARAAEIVVGNPDPLTLASEINSDVPTGIAYVLNSALALNPGARFVSAKAMRQALEHALNSDSNDVGEQPAETFVAVDMPVENQVVNSSEVEDFTALEAFATDNSGTEPIEIETPPQEERAVAAPVLIAETLTQVADDKTESFSPAETPTKVARRTKKSWLPLAAAAALLFCVVLAAGYFINKVQSSGQGSQNPEVQTTSETNSNVGEINEVLETPLKVDSKPQDLEIVEQIPPKTSSIEKTVERIESKERIEEPETKKEPEVTRKVEPVKNEAKRPAPVPAAKRKAPPEINRPRIVEPVTLPDIESIFTGRPTYEDERNRPNNRRQRDQISDEERERRRQRRQQRRQQPDNYRFPF